MSNALMRRNSNKQGLQNLMRLTAQRSIEDAEEVERERRRRAREALCRRNSDLVKEDLSADGQMLEDETMYHDDLKPNSSLSVEEDEGFSDWTQRKEKRRQQRMQELSNGGTEEDRDEGQSITRAAPVKTVQAVASSNRLHQQPQEGVDVGMLEMVRRKEYEENIFQAEREKKKKEEEQRRDEPVPRRSAEVENRKEAKISYTSKVFLQQDPKHCNSNSNAAAQHVVSYNSKTNRVSRAGEQNKAEAIVKTEPQLEKIHRGLRENESQELELEELKRRREERRQVRQEEEEHQRGEEQQRLAKEEERRRMKGLGSSNEDGEEAFHPKPTTHKITERTESLNRSLKKSNSFKKMQPPVLLFKINDKLEQYTHAVENAKDCRATKAPVTDLPGSPEVVAFKKNLFETGETWNQSPSKGSICKDVKAGDVMQKKNMWEIIGDSSGRMGHSVKASAAGKKYKFVVTGHGKYEKIPACDEGSRAISKGTSDLYHSDL
ncbi:unnamed protein product [Ophioblennius macclurei]